MCVTFRYDCSGHCALCKVGCVLQASLPRFTRSQLCNVALLALLLPTFSDILLSVSLPIDNDAKYLITEIEFPGYLSSVFDNAGLM